MYHSIFLSISHANIGVLVKSVDLEPCAEKSRRVSRQECYQKVHPGGIFWAILRRAPSERETVDDRLLDQQHRSIGLRMGAPAQLDG